MNVNVTYKFHQEFYDKYNTPKQNYDPERPIANCPTDKEIIEGAKECASDWECSIL